MNIQARYPTTPDEFLRWNEGREERWDFVDGKVVDMMVRVSRSHAALASNLLFELRSKIAEGYLVTSADFGVKTGTSVRYPDVLVDGAEGQRQDLAATAPILIAEVLSPSTMPIDFGPKADEYRTIASLRHYIVLSQDEARIWLWSRGEDGAWLKPQTFARTDGPVDLGGLGVTLDLTRLYAGVVPQDKPN